MTNSPVIDQTYMHRAIELAKLGRYTTTPNPNVGCVIVNQQRIVGEGFHQYAGGPHAEVYALQQAGKLAENATAYVTLEPCSHYGRTPPCADSLIAAKIGRVVIAMQDPNPQVSGRGIEKLKGAGIDVTIGVLEAEAKQVNRAFLQRMSTQRPFVTLKLAASLDGRTALSNGQSKWITGEAARLDVHALRAENCVIMTGADTILSDDPQLNVRFPVEQLYPKELGERELRQPCKVIIDSKNRLTANHQVFMMTGEVIVANCTANTELHDIAGSKAKITQWQIPRNGQYLDLHVLMGKLAAQGFNSIWLEAGARLSGALLQQKLVDELLVYQAPKLMGPAAKPLLDLPEFETMNEVPELNVESVSVIGSDVKITLNRL